MELLSLLVHKGGVDDGCQEAPESLEEGGIVPRQPGVDSFKELVENSENVVDRLTKCLLNQMIKYERPD